MRKRDLLLCCVAVLALCLFLPSGTAWAFRHVKAGFYQNKPLVFRDADGVVKGIYADFLNAVAVENEWTVEWVEG
ncbi:MAG TPA: hypothetical protein DCM24_02980, partial [Synergistaceae bacterium]|nr:hypothetical protein [Synergistaceae bacterium]